jgi:NhaA family Na+:H+ antiporter
VLALLGGRVPPALRILLLALAVIDDVGAILVIAIFYSSGLSWLGFALAGTGLLAVLALQAVGVRSPWAYVIPGVVVWAGIYAAGIHPTLAGVIVGLMTPVRSWLGREEFVERADASVAAVRDQHQPDGERALIPHLDQLNRVQREAISPVERIEHALHGWVAYGAMPLFALANAGVSVGDVSLAGDARLAFFGVLAGLVLGKPLGVLSFAWLATRLGIAALPQDLTWSRIGLMGLVAGIGFTMSIFIAALAFPAGATLETCKVAILAGSALAAVLAYVVGRFVLSSSAPAGARGAAEAEASTHY